MSKPKQAESHRVHSEFLFLDFALKAKRNVGLNITDPLMTQLIPSVEDKTIRRTRQKFVKKGILKRIKKLPNQPFEYDFTSLDKAIKERTRLETIFMHKQNPQIVQTPVGALLNGFTDISKHYVIDYKLKNGERPKQLYPKKFYQKRICPMCGQQKLRRFKHKNSHDLDMKCFNCKVTFDFSSDERIIVKDNLS